MSAGRRALALLGLSLWLSFAGCGKVEHCTAGTKQCLGGACEQDECAFDLICAVRPTGERVCAKFLGDDQYDYGKLGQGKGQRASELGPPCTCDAPELCSVDTNSCVNYCAVAVVSELPKSQPVPEVIFCEQFQGELPLAFEEICKRRCRLQCQRWQQYCGHECASGYCEGAEILSACREACPAGDPDPELCLTRACNAVRDQGCVGTVCPDTEKPAACKGVVCKNTCGSPAAPNWAGDGVCDDGDFASATNADCAWGTDCTDCGPRHGTPPAGRAQGSVCAFNTTCAGYRQDLTQNAAWCMELAEVQKGLSRCVPDCSRGQACPDGYECVVVLDANGQRVQHQDLVGQACMPALCGK